MTDLVIECVVCREQFTDEQVAAFQGPVCPRCGTTERPKLLGKAALAAELVEEYRAIKFQVVSGELSMKHLTARQLAGSWILVYGREQAWGEFSSLPKPEQLLMEKQWPGFQALLEKTRMIQVERGLAAEEKR